MSASKEPMTRFHAAIAQYGADDFLVETLYTYPTRQLAEEAESYLIEVLGLQDMAFGLNARVDGLPPSQLGRKRSPATLEKMSRAASGRVQSIEERIRHGDSLRGRRRPAEVIEKIAAYQRNRTPEHRARLSVAVSNMSAESRANVAAAAREGWKKRRYRQQGELAEALLSA